MQMNNYTIYSGKFISGKGTQFVSVLIHNSVLLMLYYNKQVKYSFCQGERAPGQLIGCV